MNLISWPWQHALFTKQRISNHSAMLCDVADMLYPLGCICNPKARNTKMFSQQVGTGRWAMYKVRVSKLLLTNCVQAHDNCLEVLPHINLYLSTRRPRTIGSPGHATLSFLIFPRILSFKTQTFFAKIDEKSSFFFGGAAPRTPSFRSGAPPNHQGSC